MSRIGKQPVKLPEGVTISQDGRTLEVTGPRGVLRMEVPRDISVSVNDGAVDITRQSDERKARSAHGLTRSLIDNMVTGVSHGFKRQLEIHGVGYRANASGQQLKLNLGFSHEITFKVPEGVQVAVNQNIITVEGVDKQQVGQVASEIRSLKKPEPYKGKGIRFTDEYIIRKVGKAAAGGKS